MTFGMTIYIRYKISGRVLLGVIIYCIYTINTIIEKSKMLKLLSRYMKYSNCMLNMFKKYCQIDIKKTRFLYSVTYNTDSK